jgi:hypothetical protein
VIILYMCTVYLFFKSLDKETFLFKGIIKFRLLNKKVCQSGPE